VGEDLEGVGGILRGGGEGEGGAEEEGYSLFGDEVVESIRLSLARQDSAATTATLMRRRS